MIMTTTKRSPERASIKPGEWNIREHSETWKKLRKNPTVKKKTYTE